LSNFSSNLLFARGADDTLRPMCRRFAKRIYVPMPEEVTRIVVLNKLLSKHGNPLSDDDVAQLARWAGYRSAGWIYLE